MCYKLLALFLCCLFVSFHDSFSRLVLLLRFYALVNIHRGGACAGGLVVVLLALWHVGRLIEFLSITPGGICWCLALSWRIRRLSLKYLMVRSRARLWGVAALCRLIMVMRRGSSRCLFLVISLMLIKRLLLWRRRRRGLMLTRWGCCAFLCPGLFSLTARRSMSFRPS